MRQASLLLVLSLQAFRCTGADACFMASWLVDSVNMVAVGAWDPSQIGMFARAAKVWSSAAVCRDRPVRGGGMAKPPFEACEVEHFYRRAFDRRCGMLQASERQQTLHLGSFSGPSKFGCELAWEA